MSVQEGARRMKRAGHWIVFVPLTFAVVMWGIGLAIALLRRDTISLMHGGIFFLIVFVYLAIPGVVLWIAGWIVEGFAKKES
jgi:hypothetical protein